jgi:hypothetical protein
MFLVRGVDGSGYSREIYGCESKVNGDGVAEGLGSGLLIFIGAFPLSRSKSNGSFTKIANMIRQHRSPQNIRGDQRK